MTSDTLLTLLNVLWGLLLTGIGIEMVNNPPADDSKKKWFYRILFGVLGEAVVMTTWVQSSRTAQEQTKERTRHDTEQGRLEGKLSLMSEVMGQSNCPSTAQIGEIVKQQLTSRIYLRARTPIAEGKWDSLSSNLLIQIVPKITEYLRRFRGAWYADLHEQELKDYEDEFHERDQAARSRKEKQHFQDHALVNTAYRSRLAQLLSDADSLRRALANKLPPEAYTSDDRSEVVVFANASHDLTAVHSYEDCCPESVSKEADYLDALAARVGRIKNLR